MGPSTATTPRLVGRYLVFGEIASGGMATVHYGRLTGSVGFARTVAIKRLHPQFAKDPEFVTMFLDEARLCGRIRHPNVVPTLDVVTTEGEIFLAMEYVHGESLNKLLKMAAARNIAVPPRITATILTNVLHGLHAAHEAKDEHGRPLGIVHRDVSPQNVLVGADGVARVLDFGVAKAAGRLQTTREGQVKGKLAYMAPEQLNGAAVSRQADVYAAAVVLWETLTAQRLFDGENEAMTLVRVLEGKVDPPSRFLPDLPPGSDDVVLRGLARDPAQRYQTARDLAVAIERTIGLASPAMVGEWVEMVAQSELAERQRHVSEIEHASIGASPESLARFLPAPPSSSAVVRTREEPSSQVSSISVSRNAHRSSIPHGPPGVPRALIAIVVAFVTLAAAASVFFIATQKNSASVAARAPVELHLEPKTFEVADTGRQPPAAAPIVTSAPTQAPVVTQPQPVKRVSQAVAPKTDCNPPYTIDPVTGHRKYKKNCD